MFKSRPISIATKLTRMNMVVSAMALLLACMGFIVYDLASFRDILVSNLSTQAQEAGSNSVSALLFDDPSAAERTLSAFQLAPNIVSACIYTVGGKSFAAYRRDASARIPLQPRIVAGQEESYWFEHGNVMLVHAIIFQGKRTGFVFIQSDTQALTARVKRYIAIVAIMLAVSLVFALFVSHIARRSIAEPVIRLAEVARTVSREKNYAICALSGKEEGELAVLVEAFNEMLGQIEERDRSLQMAHDELEKRVEERTAEWAAANRELESFSYSVSHDLRSPLRGIDGFSQALAEDYMDKLDSTAVSYIQSIRAAAQKMGLLIDDLLNISRVTRVHMQREAVDLSKMVQSIASELGKRDGRRQVEWVVAEGVEAFGDSRLLQIVMDNLLGNAWKYTSKHERARIEFGQERKNGSTAYFVKDDGAGFNPEYSQRLFGAFQRLHGVAEFPGTGIGLATVHRIVQRHGGRVWAEGEVEKGATFYFTL